MEKNILCIISWLGKVKAISGPSAAAWTGYVVSFLALALIYNDFNL